MLQCIVTVPEDELAVLCNDLVPNCVQQEEWLNEFTTNEQIDEENAGKCSVYMCTYMCINILYRYYIVYIILVYNV